MDMALINIIALVLARSAGAMHIDATCELGHPTAELRLHDSVYNMLDTRKRRRGCTDTDANASGSQDDASPMDIDVQDEVKADSEQNEEVIVTTNNVCALGPRAGPVSQWHSHITCIQETKLSAAAIAEARAHFSGQNK